MYRLQYEDLEKYRVHYPTSEIRILAGDTDSYFLGVKTLQVITLLTVKCLRDALKIKLPL